MSWHMTSWHIEVVLIFGVPFRILHKRVKSSRVEQTWWLWGPHIYYVCFFLVLLTMINPTKTTGVWWPKNSLKKIFLRFYDTLVCLSSNFLLHTGQFYRLKTLYIQEKCPPCPWSPDQLCGLVNQYQQPCFFSCDKQLKKWRCHSVCLSVCLSVSHLIFLSCQFCTFAPLCTLALCTFKSLHLCSFAPLHLCNFVSLHLCTSAPLHFILL